MAKRNRTVTIAKQEKWEKEGRGQGAGKDYIPGLKTQDVPSMGKKTRVHGHLTDRQHDFLSTHEKDYCFILENSDSVRDIREQYPLPLEITLHIAEECGISHPVDPVSRVPINLSTDFLITIKEDDGNFIQIARTVKQKDDLLNERVIEKFEIERRYWLQKGVNWGIVTENEINKTLVRNIISIRRYMDISNIDSFVDLQERQKQILIEAIKSKICGENIVIREISDDFDETMSLPPGTGLSIVKHLLITKQIEINLFEKINYNKPQKVAIVTRLIKGAQAV